MTRAKLLVTIAGIRTKEKMIIFVHAGPTPPPAQFADTLHITRRVAPRSKIVVIASAKHATALALIGDFFSFVSSESIPVSETFKCFQEKTKLNRDFRNGFMYHTSERFFLLADYMEANNLFDVVHLENDVVLYFDPEDKLNAFRAFADFAVPLDQNNAIPSIVWLAYAKVAARLASHLCENEANNDMESVGTFCLGNPDIARPLPTIPTQYAAARGLDAIRYCQGIDLFGGVFDAAAIGQYVGGIHWLNSPHDTRFFINTYSELDLQQCDFSWNVHNGVRQPILDWGGERRPILALHVHSKDMLAVSPFNHAIPSSESDIITGERLQTAATLTLSLPQITSFHGRKNIQTFKFEEIPTNENGQALVPSFELVERCDGAEVIFIYTDLVPYFKRYIAPHLTRRFALVTHNSDQAVTIDDRDLLDNPLMVQWWAQNVEFAHTKLSSLPIGLANSQWGAEHLGLLFEASKHIEKDKLLYANVALTHASRIQAKLAAARVAGVTEGITVPYKEYIETLRRHKFCICPRGNGIDTHRIWEALYLGCVPVIVRADWTPAYSELPLLILPTWEELPNINLQQEYIRITATSHNYDRISLKWLISQIKSLKDGLQKSS